MQTRRRQPERTGGLALAGQVAIITGASAGIGAAAARRLAGAGATVVLTARREGRLTTLADAINSRTAGRAVAVVTDITRAEDRVRLVQRTMTHTGRVDILVNNAGVSQPGVLEEIDEALLRASLELNFFAAVALMQAVIPAMREQGHGRIINVSSPAGRIGFPGLVCYAASKAALDAATDAARLELRPFGVRVSLILPGNVKTEIWGVGRELGEELVEAGGPYQRLYGSMLRTAGLAERYGSRVDVVARAILDAAASPRPRAHYKLAADGWALAALGHLPAGARDGVLSRTFRWR